jgi:hypothetical protein
MHRRLLRLLRHSLPPSQAGYIIGQPDQLVNSTIGQHRQEDFENLIGAGEALPAQASPATPATSPKLSFNKKPSIQIVIYSHFTSLHLVSGSPAD